MRKFFGFEHASGKVFRLVAGEENRWRTSPYSPISEQEIIPLGMLYFRTGIRVMDKPKSCVGCQWHDT